MTRFTPISTAQNPQRQRRWTVALLAGAAALSMMMAHTALHAQPAPQAVKLTVNGMVCAFCAQGIEARLKKMPETADLYINLKQKVVAVQAKPGQTLAIDKIRAEVTDAGYEVSQVQPLTQTVAELRDQMRGKP